MRVVINQQVLVSPTFQTFSKSLFTHKLWNLLVIMLVKSQAWRNKFLINNILKIKKTKNHDPDVWFDLPQVLRNWRERDFSLRELLFGSRVLRLHPGFVSCDEPREKVLVDSDFCRFWYEHTPMILLVGAQSKHKHRRDPPKSPRLESSCTFHSTGETRQAIFEIVFRLSSLWILQTLSWLNCGGIIWMFKSRKPRRALCFPRWHCHWKLFWALHAFLIQFFQVWKGM